MKLNKCLPLFAAIVIVILLPPSDAGKKKNLFKKVYSSASPINSVPQSTTSRPPSPTNPNPGSSGVTEARLVTLKKSFRLPGTSETHKSVEHRKHDDFPALDGNHARKVDQHARLSPPPQRKSPLPPQTELILSKNPFARLPGARKSSDHVNQPKQPEEFPPLGGSDERLNANRNPALPGSSSHAEAFNKKSLRSPEAQRKFPLQDYPALPGSSHSKNPSSRPSLESLANSQKKLSLDQFPALRGSSSSLRIPKNPPAGNQSPNPEKKTSLEEYPALGAPRYLKSSLYPVERSNSLILNSQSSAHHPAFVRGSSVDSTKDLRFSSQFDGSMNSPLQKNKNFFGSSSSSLASTSGLGASYHSTSSGSFSSLSVGRNSPGLGRGRKFSDASLVPQFSVAVSDKTCKDDTSPAEQCFNYFTFSLFWPPALGYEYKSNNKAINDNVNIARWSVHGLWPSSYGGMTPENCHKRTSVTFNQYRLEREKGLRASLENKWINICPYKQKECSLVRFWDREFTTHGACAARSPLIGSDIGYFKMAVSLSTSLDMDHLLSNLGLNPGKIMTYGDLVDKISDKIGTTVRVEIVKNRKTNECYLKEIRVCYDLNFHRINCPGKKLLLQEMRELNIRHLDYVPAI
ncbi:uncharacterized protein LOC123263515 isoform X3 [Cotesia glomerata]|uniref:uncharacterized protein LOC123263515 isoform X3 n=1 Tax=Cotesia glomerata TaxID=32391 RepID=UPI001D01DD69|nr:uncharacterized protein LOC123263515 isoform X3 [Cotesia glomerata]